LFAEHFGLEVIKGENTNLKKAINDIGRMTVIIMIKLVGSTHRQEFTCSNYDPYVFYPTAYSLPLPILYTFLFLFEAALPLMLLMPTMMMTMLAEFCENIIILNWQN
jgi:hypothetical protein